MQPCQEAVISFSIEGMFGTYSFSFPTGFITLIILLLFIGMIFHWKYKHKTRQIDYQELQRLLDRLDKEEKEDVSKNSRQEKKNWYKGWI